MKRGEPVSRRLERLYGEDPAGNAGVLHSLAVWIDREELPRVIRIGPGCPQSETDAFLLRAARMRAEALVTTGRILREEPQLSHVESDPALRAWRRERVGLASPPRTVVLTSGESIDMRHPVLVSTPRPLIHTHEGAASKLRRAAQEAEIEIEVVGRPCPSIRDTLSQLLQAGYRTILIEAGPTTATTLYDEPVGVDELLLSVYRETSLQPRWRGPRFRALAELEALFTRRAPPTPVEEPSGRWTFQRLRRAATERTARTPSP